MKRVGRHQDEAECGRQVERGSPPSAHVFDLSRIRGREHNQVRRKRDYSQKHNAVRDPENGRIGRIR